MNGADWRDLAILTITAPAKAARQILEMQIPRNVVWLVLLLVAVSNTFLFILSSMLVSGPSPLAFLVESPFTMLGLSASGLILMSFSIFWAGRMLGGKGTIDGVMALVVWLQILRLLLQVAVLVLVLIVPFLVALLLLVAVVMGFYILLHFVKEVHQLGSLAAAAGVFLFSMVVIVLGLAVIIAFLALL